MDKQEELREGVARIGLGGIEPLKNARPNENGYNTADDILSYLHSQGVVIRVDRKLPVCALKYSCDWFEGYEACKDVMAGLVATEPLIGKTDKDRLIEERVIKG